MAKIIGKSRRRRTTTTQQLCHRMVHHVNVHCNLFHRVSFLGRFIWDRMLLCSLGRPSYLRLPLRDPPPQATVHGGASMHGYPVTTTTPSPCDSDSDLVNLKISLLGWVMEELSEKDILICIKYLLIKLRQWETWGPLEKQDGSGISLGGGTSLITRWLVLQTL